jgi:tetratricopeptide (TPR) repeat protein
MLASGPTLLVLEDLHWADEATLDLLRFLGRRLSGLRALLVVTYRPEDVPPHHVFSVMLGDLAGIRGVDRINLAPLSLGGVREFLASSSFGGDAELLYRTTGGNPFYLTEVVATGSDSLPGTIRDAVLARTARLSPAASRALSAAAVLGQRADAQVIATVAGEPMSAVDQCIQQGLLVADGQSWAFRHELARLAVEQSLLPGVKASLHANALRVLAALDPSAHRGLAHHAAGAADFGALLEHAPPAAAAAARLGAHREAAAYYRLALRVPGLPADQRARFYEALSYECYLISEVEEALAARHRALDLFQMLDDRAAVGATERSLSRLSWLLGRSDDGRRYALRAITTLEPLGDGHELAMAYSNMAQLSMLAGEITETVDWASARWRAPGGLATVRWKSMH